MEISRTQISMSIKKGLVINFLATQLSRILAEYGNLRAYRVNSGIRFTYTDKITVPNSLNTKFFSAIFSRIKKMKFSI